MKAYYTQMLKEGEKIVADIKNGNGAKKEESVSESEKSGEEKIPSAESEKTDKKEEEKIAAEIKNVNETKKDEIVSGSEMSGEAKIFSDESEKMKENRYRIACKKQR